MTEPSDRVQEVQAALAELSEVAAYSSGIMLGTYEVIVDLLAKGVAPEFILSALLDKLETPARAVRGWSTHRSHIIGQAMVGYEGQFSAEDIFMKSSLWQFSIEGESE
jgi:hypothetical protein